MMESKEEEKRKIQPFEWIIFGVGLPLLFGLLAVAGVTGLFVGVGTGTITMNKQRSYSAYFDVVNGTVSDEPLPAFYMFDQSHQTVYIHMYIIFLYLMQLGIPMFTQNFLLDSNGIDRIIGEGDILSGIGNNAVFFFMACLPGMTWEVLWEIYEVVTSTIAVIIAPGDNFALYYFIGTVDVIPDLIQGVLACLFFIPVLFLIVKLLGIKKPAGVLWARRQWWNKLIYVGLIILFITVTPLDHYNVIIGTYELRVGCLTWIWIGFLLFVFMHLLDLLAWVKIPKDQWVNYPSKKEVYGTNGLLFLSLVVFHSLFYGLSEIGMNTYIITLIGIGVYLGILGILGLLGWRIVRCVSENSPQKFIRWIKPRKWIPTQLKWKDLVITTIVICVLVIPALICLSILFFVEPSSGWYLANVEYANWLGEDFHFMEFFTKVSWEMIHMWWPALIVYKYGGPLLVYAYRRNQTPVKQTQQSLELQSESDSDDEGEAQPVRQIHHRLKKGDKFPPPFHWAYILCFCLGVGVEVVWEIIEFLIGEAFMPLLNEHSGDSIGDLIQAIVGSAFVTLMLAINGFGLRRPSFLLWEFRSLLNKGLYFAFTGLMGAASFLSVFNKRFNSGLDLALGYWAWMFFWMAIFMCLRYLDLIVEIPEEIQDPKSPDNSPYPTRRDINHSWIVLAIDTLLMMLVFYAFTFFNTYSYVSCYVGLGVVIGFHVIVWMIKQMQIY